MKGNETVALPKMLFLLWPFAAGTSSTAIFSNRKNTQNNLVDISVFKHEVIRQHPEEEC